MKPGRIEKRQRNLTDPALTTITVNKPGVNLIVTKTIIDARSFVSETCFSYHHNSLNKTFYLRDHVKARHKFHQQLNRPPKEHG